MPTLSERITQLLISGRWPLLGVVLILSILAARPAGQVAFDESIENMFSVNDPLLVPYRKLKRVFGGDEIVLLVYDDAELMAADREGLERVSEVSRRCEQVPGVRDVLSLDRLSIGTSDILDTESTLAANVRKLFENYTHDPAGRTAVVVCMLEPTGATTETRRATIGALRRIAEDLPDGLSSGMLAGEPVLVADSYQHVEADGHRLGRWSMVLLGATFIVCFRSLRWVIVPLVVVQVTLVLTRATLALSGLRLSMVSSMLTAIVTVIGVATVAHIIVRYRQIRSTGLEPREALTQTAVLLVAPIFFACVTDAMGFAALTAADVGPVRDFGLMMAIGSLFVMVGVACIVPGLALWGRVDVDPRRAWGEDYLDAGLGRLTRFACRSRWLMVAVSLALLAWGLGGISRLRIETDFTKNFRADSQVIRSSTFVEDRLGGAGAFDIVLPAPDRLDWEYLERILVLERRLRQEVVVSGTGVQPVAGLTKVLSIADLVVGTSPVDLEKVRLKALRGGMVRAGLKGMQLHMEAFYDALYHADPADPQRHYFRIMLRTRERQSAADKELILQGVRRIVAEEFPDSEQEAAEVTGFYVLLTHLVSSLLRDQWLTFAIASGGMALVMLCAFRSLTLTLIALLPNALPIVVVMGLLGWSGLPVNMGAAMISAVSIGLSVDGSIHYLTFFRRARRAGKTVAESIDEVQQGVGPAMVFATLALIVGFAVLCGSEFIPTVYFGALVSLSMLGGLIGNLMLLPALLTLLHRD